mmetsp:Transcript_71518/g.210048  ORF Transcript_71518/g.210048 Transcript_71518/m.210048 type:complete len:319 (+) Transcript_71518:309-1265(+)
MSPRAFSRRYLLSISLRSVSAVSLSRTWNRIGWPGWTSSPTMRPPSGVTPVIMRMSQSPSPTCCSFSPCLPRPMTKNFCIFSRIIGSTAEKIMRSASLAGLPPRPVTTGPWTSETFTGGPAGQHPWQTMVWTSMSVSMRPAMPCEHSLTGVPSQAIATDGMNACLSSPPTWSCIERPPAFTACGNFSSSVFKISSTLANGSPMRSMDLTSPLAAILLTRSASPSPSFPRKKGVAPASRMRATERTALPPSTSIGGQSAPAAPPPKSEAFAPAAWPMAPPTAQPIRVWTFSFSRSCSRKGPIPCAMVTCSSCTKAMPVS